MVLMLCSIGLMNGCFQRQRWAGARDKWSDGVAGAQVCPWCGSAARVTAVAAGGSAKSVGGCRL